MLDAYTVRKAVPRILLAVIGINLSIYLCVAALDLTTIVGKGIGQLFNEAFIPNGFKVDPELLDYSFEGTVATAGILAILAKGVIGAGSGALISSLMPLLLIVGLIALAVFFTLVIRQGLLIFLTVLSPIAMACFVLPGTEKYFQKWFDIFLKTLMTYPIIASIFAMSNVMASIILGGSGGVASFTTPATIINSPLFAQASSGDSDAVSVLKLFTGIIVIYAPLAMIPFSFKLAGGALGAVMNAAERTTAGKRGQLQKGRAGKLDQARAERAAKFERGGFKNQGIGRAYNAVGRRKAAGARNRYGFGERGRASLGLSTDANTDETLKNNAALRALANNDDANNLLALSGGSEAGMKDAAQDLFKDKAGNYDQARAERAMAAARAAGVTRENAAAALKTSAQNKWRAVDAGRSDLIQEGIGRLAGGNESEAAGLAYGNQFFSRTNGRADLGGNYLDVNDQAVQDYSATHGVSAVEAQRSLATLDGIQSRVSAAETVRGHTEGVKAESEVLRRAMQAGTPQERVLAAERMLELNGHKAGAAPENKNIINDMLSQAGVDLTSKHSAATQLAAQIGGLNQTELDSASSAYDQHVTNQRLEQQALSATDPTDRAALRAKIVALSPAEQANVQRMDSIRTEAARLTKRASVYGDDIPENMRGAGG